MLAGLGLVAASAAAAQTPQPPPDHRQAGEPESTEVGEVVVTGDYAPRQVESPRMTRALIDTPQSITVLPDELLQEQGRRTLRDAMRNITGVSIMSGEGAPQQGGGDILTIRGFNARDDILVDNIRDVGTYFRDPFNTDQIEVFKGPSSAFAGQGNTGGTINIVSRLPRMSNFGSADVSVGTDSYQRYMVDANHVLSEERGMAARIDAVFHDADEPGRDQVHNRRWGVAAALAYGLDSDTEMSVDWFHLQQNNQPDLGIPNARQTSFIGSGFEGRAFPVNRSNYYGYTTDYQDVTVDRITGRLTYVFSDFARLRTTARYGRVHADQVISAPIVSCACATNSSDSTTGLPTTITAATTIQGFAKPRDQVEEILISQTDLSLDFTAFGFEHRSTLGIEIGMESLDNRRRIDRLGPALNAYNPAFIAAPAIPYQGTRARLTTDTRALYAFDSAEAGPWILSAGVRFDDVTNRVQGIDEVGLFPTYRTDLTNSDTEVSVNAGVVYRPTDDTRLYLAYANAFEPSAKAETVRTAGRNNNPPTTPGEFFVDPERSWTVEFGGRAQMFDRRLQLSAAVFQITKTNARTPGVNPGDPPIVSQGEQRVRGLEFSAQGALTPDWDIYFGYTYLDGRYLRSNFAPDRGRRLDFIPEHTVALWTSYEISDRWKVGGGIQYISDRISDVTATRFVVVTSPGYTVADLFAEYRATSAVTVRLNIYNATDESYFQSFQNNHSIPSARRQAVLTVNAAF